MSSFRTSTRPKTGRERLGLRIKPRSGRRLVVALAAVAAVSIAGVAGVIVAPSAAAAGAPDFGANVKIFDPSMPTSQIQSEVDAISARQIDNEMGTERYSLLFKPGTYGTPAAPLKFQVGYYTEVAGLGQNPTDVTINGSVDVYNRCITVDKCFALNSFWRSLSNLTVNVSGGTTDCRKTGMFWAASQASPMRRVNINGNLTLMDYCTNGPQWASGGFIADSKTDTVTNGSQQQYLVRNSTIGTWSNGVWNQVFAGVQGAPTENFSQPITNPDNTAGFGTYTTLPTNPTGREKPYLYLDSSGNYNVFVPKAAVNSSGTTWQGGQTAGKSIPLANFYLAKPTDSVATINSQLSSGKNLILTPGVYDVDKSIAVNRSDTIVLGMGIATLTAVNGSVPLTIGDVKGVVVAGIMIDAGTVNSPSLLNVGTQNGTDCTDPADPTTLSDVFVRIGGPHVGKATLGIVVNSDNVILDDIWSWRADHGVDGSFGWNINTSDTGLVVNGDNVTATGLFVEHYKKYNVIWNGENGRTVFFQNELPYDPPNAAAWSHDGVVGYAGYKVANSVRKHELWGGGSYIYTNIDPSIHATRAFEVPATPGVKLHHLLTVQLLAGIIDHVVNNTGDATPGPVAAPSFVLDFPTGATSTPTSPQPGTASGTCTNQPTTPVTPSTDTPTTSTPTTSTPTTSTPTTSTPTTSTPPVTGAPGNLRFSTSGNAVTLTWTGDAGATYDILRGEDGVKIASVQGNTFTDGGLNQNTPYVYSVRNSRGTTPQITVVLGAAPTGGTAPTNPTGTTSTPSTPSNGAPSNLHKTGQTSGSITIGWTGPAGEYDILRGEDGVKIASVTGTTFTDIGLLPNTPYVYSVRNTAGVTTQVTVRIS